MTIPRVPTARHGNCSYPDLKRRLSMFRALIFDSNVGRRHPEPPGGAEGPGHATLVGLERRLDGVLFVGSPACRWRGWRAARSQVTDRRATGASIERRVESHTMTARSMTFLQLADIAGPVVRLKQLRRLPGDAADSLADACGVAMGKYSRAGGYRVGVRAGRARPMGTR